MLSLTQERTTHLFGQVVSSYGLDRPIINSISQSISHSTDPHLQESELNTSMGSPFIHSYSCHTPAIDPGDESQRVSD